MICNLADNRSPQQARPVARASAMLAGGLALVLSLLLTCAPAVAQVETPATPERAAPQARPAFSQQELDQMLAPIALYPDALLSQILMASTYPLEVVEAARWSRANPGVVRENAVKAVQQEDWDPSVKSLVAFPQILQMMDEKLEWTERMGDAFLAQETQVTTTIQNLRHKAYDAGNLSSNEQVRVERQGQTIVIVPASPDVIYVPYYDPVVVYGSWWWPDYPPIYWAPWPGYYYAPRYAPGFAWGFGITIGAGFFFGAFDWPHYRVHVVNVIPTYYYGPRRHDGHGLPKPGIWQHDPDHRRGVPYRDLSLRQHYGRSTAAPETRRDYRGYDLPPSGARGGFISPPRAPAPNQRPVEIRPNTGGGRADRPHERGFENRANPPKGFSRPPLEARPPALEDIGRGDRVRSYSTRGRASQEGILHRQGGQPARPPAGNMPAGRSRHPG
ncbi:MAG TPA: DUF3300 domain-containing protein [Gallionellaceae bacterium]